MSLEPSPSSVAVSPPVAEARTEGSGAPAVGDHERRQLTARAGIVALGTLASRLLGLVRDQVIAATFRLAATDAFFVAFTIPNVFRQLLAEGAVQTAVLPVLEGVKEREGDEAARQTFATLRGLSLLVLSGVTIAGILFAEPLVELFAGGYRSHAGQFERTVLLTRWMFPYIFFMGTAALGVAALNVNRRFKAASFAPALLNVAFIACSVGLPGWLLARGSDPLYALVLAVLLGGALQVVAQWPSLRAIGYLTLPRFDFRQPAVREALRRMGPVLVGLGIYYLDVILARRFLSELAVGSQSYFNWALRLCDFPQGIFIMALQSATLPSLSRLVARGELDEVARTFSYGMRLTLFVAIAATVGFVALAEPITVMLFQHGQFGREQAHQTARALMAQGAGIWLVAAVRQLVSVYYALGETKTPVRVAAIDLCVFLVAAWYLRGPLGHAGVGVAVTAASFVQAGLLWHGLRKRLPTRHGREILGSAVRTLAASAGGAVAALLLLRVVPTTSTLLGRLLPGLLACTVFGVTVLALAWLIGSPEMRGLTRGIARWRRS